MHEIQQKDFEEFFDKFCINRAAFAKKYHKEFGITSDHLISVLNGVYKGEATKLRAAIIRYIAEMLKYSDSASGKRIVEKLKSDIVNGIRSLLNEIE